MEHGTQSRHLILAGISRRRHRRLLGLFIGPHLGFVLALLLLSAMESWAQENEPQNIPALVEQFRNPDRELSYKASRQLIQQGQSIVSELVPLLDDSDSEIRSRTAWALGAIGPAAVEAVPRLVKLIQNPEEKEFVLRNAAEALSAIGPAVTADLLWAMKNVDNRARYFFINAIGMMQASARPALLRALKHDDPEIRQFAAVILARGGYEAEKVIPLLMQIAANKDLDKDIRSAACDFFGRYGESARVASKLLLSITLDKTESLDIRNPAVLSLGLIKPAPDQVLVPLVALLQSADEHELVRRNTAKALGKIGEPVDEITSALMHIIKDGQVAAAVRGGAALGLSYMETNAAPAVLELMEMLKDDDYRIRQEAMTALQNIPPRRESAGLEFIVKLPFFRKWLESGEREQMMMATIAIAHIGPAAKTEIPTILKLLKMREEPMLRASAVRALGYISLGEADAKEALVEIIRSGNEDLPLRVLAMTALSQTGPDAASALWAIADLFKEDQPTILHEAFGRAIVQAEPSSMNMIPEILKGLDQTNQNLREVAAFFLWVIAKNIHPKIETLRLSELTDLSDGLQKARIIFNESEVSQKLLDFYGRMDVTYAKELEFRKGNPFVKIMSWCYQHRAITGVLLYLFLMPVLWAVILWVSPLSILKVNQAITPVKDIKLSGWLGGLNLPIRLALMVQPFLYHRRVMDAWVGLHADAVLENFSNKQTVKDRSVFINLPVVLEGSTLAGLNPGDLGSIFRKQRARLLIWGEGGSGKTSLACQIAIWALSEDPSRWICNHRMLPILIEHDLNGDADDAKSAVLQAIQGQLDDLVGRAGSISQEFLKTLLIQRRLLVIVDHLSEMMPATRALIRPELPDFHANALIITSRVDEDLGGVARSVCKPLRISGNRLSSFMEAYLTKRGVRDQFNDSEFFEGCQKLSALVRDRQITALMAKLFAEQMIRLKGGENESDLPVTVPDLMLSYLNELYPNASREELRAVQRDAKIVAWTCLEGHFVPGAADYCDVVRALDGESVEERLKFLEYGLRLITTIGPAQDKIRFNLDPLAEHLAAQFLADHYRTDKSFWHSFFERAGAMVTDGQAIGEFVIAIYECWMVKGMDQRFPDLTTQWEILCARLE